MRENWFKLLKTSFTFIYRVCWLLVAVGGWPMVLCHVSWPHWLLLENLGEHSELQNVVVFLRIHHNVVVFIMIFIWFHHVWMYMSFLVHHMHVKWISGQCPWVVSFALISKCCWIMPFQVLPWNACRREKSGFTSLFSCFEGLCGPCTISARIRV